MDEIVIDSGVFPVSGIEEAFRNSSARLAPWQVKLAKEGMIKQLGVGLRIADVAERLALSETHFAKAFRNSVGMPPYQWFQRARITSALRLLAETTSSISDIAAACGYSGESHFITAFSRAVGTTPGRWRRRCHKDRPVPGARGLLPTHPTVTT